jgi:alpha-galactosidase
MRILKIETCKEVKLYKKKQNAEDHIPRSRKCHIHKEPSDGHLFFPYLAGSTISLMDIDEKRLANITALAKKAAAQQGKGADYVILMIQVGGLNAYALDVEIPLKYVIYQAVGDTLGSGGVFRGLRTIPVLLDIYYDMTKLCPDALFMNYVNPMAINCMALYKAV